MFDNLFRTDAMDVEKFVAPVREFNALVVDSAEKMVNLQIEAARGYTEFGLGNVRELMSVKDVEGLQAYATGRQDAVKALAEKVQGDAQSFAGLQQDFGEQLQKLVTTNVTAERKGNKAAPNAANSASAK